MAHVRVLMDELHYHMWHELILSVKHFNHCMPGINVVDLRLSKTMDSNEDINMSFSSFSERQSSPPQWQVSRQHMRLHISRRFLFILTGIIFLVALVFSVLYIIFKNLTYFVIISVFWPLMILVSLIWLLVHYSIVKFKA